MGIIGTLLSWILVAVVFAVLGVIAVVVLALICFAVAVVFAGMIGTLSFMFGV